MPFWDELDIIGIDAYFPLTGSNDPTKEDLIAAWEIHADEIQSWREEMNLTDKDVILTEIGYPSADGANTQPWIAVSNVEDQQEQAAPQASPGASAQRRLRGMACAIALLHPRVWATLALYLSWNGYSHIIAIAKLPNA